MAIKKREEKPVKFKKGDRVEYTGRNGVKRRGEIVAVDQGLTGAWYAVEFRVKGHNPDIVNARAAMMKHRK